MDEDLIDRIYECAFVPEQWPGLLDDLSKIANARGGAFFAINSATIHHVQSQSLDELTSVILEGGYPEKSLRTPRVLGSTHPGFFRECDMGTDEEWSADPLYREILYPNDLGYSVALSVTAPTHDLLCISLERELKYGSVEDSVVARLDTLRPHLARSILTSGRLHLERAQAATATLSMLGLPALVFNALGKVVTANPLIESLSDLIHWRAHDRIALVDRNADALFKQAVQAIDLSTPAQTRSFAIRNKDGSPAMIAHVVPVRRAARDIFSLSAGVLMLTPLTLSEAPSVELVQSLFDLTPAEARVARHLTAGQSVEQIAIESGVSANTVRTQVRGVLEKTGCTRQAEVVSLLSGTMMI